MKSTKGTGTYSKASQKPVLFIFADAGCDTGFAQVTHNLIDQLWLKWDIHVLAINYQGDPHPIQKKCKLYNPSAKVNGDYYGTHRVGELLSQIKPDLFFMINDPWVASGYLQYMKRYTGPKVLYTPIDALNLKREYIEPLNAFDHVVGYTQFAVDQMLDRGLTTTVSHLPHGIDTKLYTPIDRAEARKVNEFPQEWFIVNVTDRNQVRKRIDLAFYAFKLWVETTDKPDSVKIHYHGAMQDEGWDIIDLSNELGLRERLIITAPNITAQNGLPLHLMPYVYAPADMGLSQTMGEGWGLTTMERMAMRIPMALPNFSALGEWAKDGAHLIDIADEPFFNKGGLNTRGGIPSLKSTINALETFYVDAGYRNHIAQKGYELVTQKKFQWYNIAKQFDVIFTDAIANHVEIKDEGNGTDAQNSAK